MRTLSFMGICAFVASGLNFDVDRYLTNSPFKPVNVFRKGQIPAKENPDRQPRPDSGFVVLLSQDNEPNLFRQIQEALAFLLNRGKELDHLTELGVDNMLLDFGVQQDDRLQHSQYLPPELILALGAWKMGVVFSTIQVPRG
jgi:hypothetical protein